MTQMKIMLLVKKSNSKTITSKSFEYKTKLIGSTPNNDIMLDAEVVVPLKYLSNFWRYFDLPLINCEIDLDWSWSKECIISEISIMPRVSGNPRANPPTLDVKVIQTTGATFQINNAKIYIPVITLSINDNIEFLGKIKKRFKRIISWNKYRSEIKTQSKNNFLDYLIDPTLRNINRLLALSSKMVMTILQETPLINITCH